MQAFSVRGGSRSKGIGQAPNLPPSKPFTNPDRDFVENVGHMVVRKDGTAVAMFGMPIKSTKYFALDGKNPGITYVPLFHWTGSAIGKITFEPIQTFTAQWNIIDPAAEAVIKRDLPLPKLQLGTDPQGLLYSDLEAVNQLIAVFDNAKWAFDAFIEGKTAEAVGYIESPFWGAKANLERSEAIIRTLASLGILSEDRAEWFLSTLVPVAQGMIEASSRVLQGDLSTGELASIGELLLQLADRMADDLEDWTIDAIASYVQVHADLAQYVTAMRGVVQLLEKSSLSLSPEGRASIAKIKDHVDKLSQLDSAIVNSAAGGGIDLPAITDMYMGAGGVQGLGDLSGRAPSPRVRNAKPRAKKGTAPKPESVSVKGVPIKIPASVVAPKPPRGPSMWANMKSRTGAWFGKFRSWIGRQGAGRPSTKSAASRSKKSQGAVNSTIQWLGLAAPGEKLTIGRMLGGAVHTSIIGAVFTVAGHLTTKKLFTNSAEQLEALQLQTEAQLQEQAKRLAVAAGKPETWPEYYATLKQMQLEDDKKALAGLAAAAHSGGGLVEGGGSGTGSMPPDVEDPKGDEYAKLIDQLREKAKAAGVKFDDDDKSIWPWVLGGVAVVGGIYYFTRKEESKA